MQSSGAVLIFSKAKDRVQVIDKELDLTLNRPVFHTYLIKDRNFPEPARQYNEAEQTRPRYG